MPTIHTPPQGGKLIVWSKGESGNPKGKAKGTRSIKTILNEFLAEDYPNSEAICDVLGIPRRKLSYKDMMALRQVGDSIKGSVESFKAVIDRTDGKVKDESEQTGARLSLTLNANDLQELSESVQNLLIKKQQPKEVIEVKAEETVVNPCNYESH